MGPETPLNRHTRAVLPRMDPAGWRPTLIVAGIIGTIFFGSQLLNGVIPTPARPGRPGAPVTRPASRIDAGEGVSVALAAGWSLAEAPADSGVGARLQKGAATLDVYVVSGAGDPAELYADYVESALRPFASALNDSNPELVRIGAGRSGARGSYTGLFGGVGQIEGQLTALTAEGRGVVFDGWGPSGRLAPALPEIELMIDTVEIR